jgi:hypothetical protein
LIRADHNDGRQTEASVPLPFPTDLEDLAHGLLATLAGVSRVRIWEDGLIFTDEPTVDVTVGVVPPQAIAHDVADIATALLLMDDPMEAPGEPPAWLKPYTSRGPRPASGS